MVTVRYKDVVDTTFDKIATGTIFYDFETDGVWLKTNDEYGALLLEDGSYSPFSPEDIVAEIDVEIIWSFAKPR